MEKEKEKEKGKRRSSPTTPSVNLCLGLAIYSHELVRQMVRTTIALEGGQNRTRIWDNDKFAFFLKKSYRECNLCCTVKKKKWIAKKVAVLFKNNQTINLLFLFFFLVPLVLATPTRPHAQYINPLMHENPTKEFQLCAPTTQIRQ